MFARHSAPEAATLRRRCVLRLHLCVPPKCSDRVAHGPRTKCTRQGGPKIGPTNLHDIDSLLLHARNLRAKLPGWTAMCGDNKPEATPNGRQVL